MFQATPTLRAAAVEAVIPSQPGLDLAGFVARENPSLGKHDEIYARALALEVGAHLMLLLQADTLGFDAQVVVSLRSAIAEQLAVGLPRQTCLSVMVAATHTHSAPASMPLRNCGAVNEAWLRQACTTLVETALAAARQLQPARLGIGSGTVNGVAFNRRTPGRTQGQVTLDDAGLMPEPIDPALGVLRVETPAGSPLACMVNFTCHPVILGDGNRDISADYPGVAAQQLKRRLGAVTLFTNGAAGDVNPVRRGSQADVEYLAGAVIAEAERIWETTQAVATTRLRAAAQMLTLPLLPAPPREELIAAISRFREEYESARQSGHGAQMRVADAYRQWAEEILGASAEDFYSDLEIQALRLGDAAIIAVPGELFVELGLEIKRRLAQQGISPTFIFGYTNGNIGYIPTRSAYPLGGYEVETAHRFYGRPSCAAPEAGEMIVERAVALATKL